MNRSIQIMLFSLCGMIATFLIMAPQTFFTLGVMWFTLSIVGFCLGFVKPKNDKDDNKDNK